MSNSKKSSGENRCRNTSGNRGGRGKRENWRNRSTDGNAERPTGGLPGGRRPHPFHARSASSSNDQSDSAGRPKNRKHQSRDGDRRPPHRNDDQQNPRKIRQMGFKFLQELLMKEDLEAVVLSLSNDRKGFKELLETRQVSNDVIVLILRLLCKISECSFRSAKVGLFESALRSAFSDNVIRYVSTIAIQSDHDKRFNSEFWKDTDQFWNNIIQISRTMQDLIPTTSCDVTSKLLKAVKLYIPIIETTHSIHISDTIKNEIEELFVM
nr:NFX1-type zinc finger-containing protein 1-like [Leptinotarsa decemlineata]